MQERDFAGVAAVIVIPGNPEKGVLTIEELNTNRGTNKLRHMRSIPMESREEGETPEDTLKRLLVEEVSLSIFYHLNELTRLYLCCGEPAKDKYVLYYLLRIPSLSEISHGTTVFEVNNIKWIHPKEILETPPHVLHYRPGNYEALELYQDYSNDPENFVPGRFFYPELYHQIPPALFDLLEEGVSEKEAASRVGVVLPP